MFPNKTKTKMKNFLFALMVAGIFSSFNNTEAQQFKAGVFDIDLMVQAMPGYARVDSLTRQYEVDSLGAEYQIYNSEYHRLDSTFKADSAAGKSKTTLDFTANQRRQVGMNIVYWQQIAQNKSDQKRGQLAQPLYEQVATAYKKVLDAKKYSIVLKPQTYEMGFPIDNIFISVAKELKLTQLPQQLLMVGDDPDAKPAPGSTGTTSKPATSAPKKP